MTVHFIFKPFRKRLTLDERRTSCTAADDPCRGTRSRELALRPLLQAPSSRQSVVSGPSDADGTKIFRMVLMWRGPHRHLPLFGEKLPDKREEFLGVVPALGSH